MQLSRLTARTVVRRPLVLIAAMLANFLGGGWIVKTKGRFDSAVLNLLSAQLAAVQFLGLLHNHFTRARELPFLLEGAPETRAASEDAFPRPGQSRALGATGSRNFLFAYARRKGPNRSRNPQPLAWKKDQAGLCSDLHP